MSRFLVFADLHLNLWTYGATLEGGFNSRLLQQKEMMSHLFEYANENRVDQILFCGDWFHTHGHVDTEVLYVSSQIMDMNHHHIPMTMLVGNHDLSTKDWLVHSMSHLKSKYITVIDHPTVMRTKDGFNIYAHPYTEDERGLKEFLGGAEPGSLVLLHQGVNNVPLNSKGFTLNEILRPESIPAHVACAFTGHYHSCCRVTEQLFIPGSPMQYTWRDTGEDRGWLDVKMWGNSTEVTMVPYTKAPKFIEVHADNLKSSDLVGNFVRIIAPNEAGVENIRKDARDSGALSVEVRVQQEDKKEVRIEEDKFTTPDELFLEYVNEKGLEERVVKVGRSIVEDSYHAPVEPNSK